MKKLILMLGIALLGACSNQEPQAHYVSVMIDVTDSEAPIVSKEQIKQHAFLNDVNASVEFSISTIDELAYTKRHSVFISKAETGVFYDEVSRKAVLSDYLKHVDTLLMYMEDISYGRNYSNIFGAVVKEVRLSMQKDVDSRTIHIYSDLIENSRFFSLSNRSHRKLLGKPEALRSFFEEEFMLKENESFEGVEIIIYHFPTRETESDFEQFLELYKSVFESRGTIVTHQLTQSIQS